MIHTRPENKFLFAGNNERATVSNHRLMKSKLMAWPKTKTAIVVGAGILLVGGMAFVVWALLNRQKVETTFDSFGPQKAFNRRVVWSVSISSRGYRGQAEWFIPKTSGRLSAIEMAMRRGSGNVDIFIAEDRNGIPGPVMEHFNESNIFQPSANLIVLKSASRPELKPGTKYWLCAEPVTSNTDWGWFQNSQNEARGFAFERGQGKWEFVAGGRNSGAFSVSITPIK